MADPFLGVIVLFLLFAVGGAFGLYFLVRDEHKQREILDREKAEQSTRQDKTDN